MEQSQYLSHRQRYTMQNSINPSGSVILVLCILLGNLIPYTCETYVDSRPCPNPLLSKCTCDFRGSHIFKVNCTNTGFTDVSPLGAVPPTVEQIVFTGNNIPVLYPNLMGNGTNYMFSCRNMTKLIALDLSRNNIHTIKGKAFHCMRQLEILILDNNEWLVDEERTTRTFSSLRKLKNLSLNNALVNGSHNTHLSNVFFDSFVADKDNANMIEEIHLEDNHLEFFTSELFCGLTNIKRVYFSRNNISTPRINHSCLQRTNLTEIHLDNNNITFFPPSILESLSRIQSLRVVNFSNNPFRCDCNFISSYRWLKGGKRDFVVGKNTFTCSSPVEYEHVLIMDGNLTEEDLKQACLSKKAGNHAERARKIQTSYIILAIIFAILGVLFIAVMYLNRYKIQKKLHVHIVEPIRESMLGKNMHYGYASVSV